MTLPCSCFEKVSRERLLGILRESVVTLHQFVDNSQIQVEDHASVYCRFFCNLC